jgi:error-prone DNA polymerase
MTEPYVELHCHSYFSLLDAASSPERLIAHAVTLGYHALALTDHDSLSGAVRFWVAAREAQLHPIIGAEINLEDNYHLTLLAETQRGYANLCTLLTLAHCGELAALDLHASPNQWPGKAAPYLTWDNLAAHAEGLILLSGCRRGPVTAALLAGQEKQAKEAAGRLRDIFGLGHTYIELQHHRLPDDNRLIAHLVALARTLDLPYVATNNVHHATRKERRLHDVLIAVRYHESLTQARRIGHLPSNHNDYLASPDEMAHRFQELPQAIANTAAIASRCQVSLDLSGRRLPAFPTPAGMTEFRYLYELCHAALPRRYPDLKPAVLTQLAHELNVIEQAGLAGYFLIVWDIVDWARRRGILCQGRGSAANSIVAYLLGITGVDPLRHNLLFERFLSPDQHTTPDIDLDFARDRREEVIAYIYDRYGAAYVAMVCNTVTYQARSAVRDLGKTLDFPPDVIDRLVHSLDVYTPVEAAARVRSQLPQLDAAQTNQTHPLRLLAELLEQIDGCPRHLGIHVGGMIITKDPLSEVVPLQRATMPGRIVTTWDKDSSEDAGLVKIDILSLATLTMIGKILALVKETRGFALDLEQIPLDDRAVFAMIHRADTIGVFQVESRAQQQMIPRMKPVNLEELAVAIAIIRPGPIQGNAIHPYLRRRAGMEEIRYPHPSLEPVLRETLGVLLYQEQVIRVAMVIANFTPAEADGLRRAMTRSRSHEAMAALRGRFVAGALQNGVDLETANAIYDKLANFASYGFCKSHAMSFALITYQTAYLRQYYPVEFYTALLSSQPLGFYDPEVIVGDAKRHGVKVLGVDIHRSGWEYRIEGKNSIRMGMQAIVGLGEQGWQIIEQARQNGPFTDLVDFCRRVRLPKRELRTLIRAGAFDELAGGPGARRTLLWQMGEIDIAPDELPLEVALSSIDLPPLSEIEQTAWEYELTGLSPQGNLMRHYRPALRRAGVASVWQVKQMEAGQKIQVAGMTAVLQRPPTAKGVLFVSLEDESGLLDLVIRPDVYEQVKPVLRQERLLLIEGRVQRAGGVVSVLVYRVFSLSERR